MDSIDFTEFSTSGVNNSDTFDIWRKKTNGIVDKLNSINESISAVPVTLNTNQTLTGAKTFSEGTAEFPVLKIGLAGLFSEYNELISTVPFKSSKIIAQEQLQLGNYSLAVPVDNPSANSLLGKSGETLTWTTLSSIISQVRSEGAAAAFTTNIVLPVGTVHAYSSAIAPVGWYICNGTRFKGSVAPELAAVLLDTYGSIYSTETGGTPVSAAPVYNAELYYTLPDLRGRALVGMGYGFDGTADQRLFNLGETGGKFAHTLLVSEMPAHSHITAAGGAHTHKFNLDTTGNYNSILAFGRNDINSEIPSNITTGYSLSGASAPADDRAITIVASADHTHTILETGGGTPHSILQPYTVTNYIIKATPDNVINTILDRGNAFDIIRGGAQQQSLSLASGGTSTLNIRHNATLTVDVNRQLGIARDQIGTTHITNLAIEPRKLSVGAPSWDLMSALYEGNDPLTRSRVATRQYVDSKTFKAGPTAKLVTHSAASRHTSAPGFSEFCYINHDGVPIITGKNRENRFGYLDKHHCEMPLPDNRRAVELFVAYEHMCSLDDAGQLWVIGNVSLNRFNIVPWPFNTSVASVQVWTKAFTPVYDYTPGNKIKKVIFSPDVTISNIAVIDTSNRLWIAGGNTHGILGRTDLTADTSTRENGEVLPIIGELVIDAFLAGGAGYEVCVALTTTGIKTIGYGGNGQMGNGAAISINSTIQTAALPANITAFADCEIYGSGASNNTGIFVKTPNNQLFAWGSNASGTFGNGTKLNSNTPTRILGGLTGFNITKVYTTAGSQTDAVYISGLTENPSERRGGSLVSTAIGSKFGTSISSSDDGNILAIGAPAGAGRVEIYKYTNQWNNLSAIEGSETSSRFGTTVSLNSSGTLLVVGSPDGQFNGLDSRKGQVRVYDYISSVWTRIDSSSLFGELADSKYGEAVALSRYDRVFVIGAPGYTDGDKPAAGRVYVKRISETNTITDVGSAITGSASGQECGKSVAISADGKIIAVSSNGASLAGVVRVYRLDPTGWTQIGEDINGLAPGAGSTNISLSGNGMRIAIGSPGTANGGVNSGTVRVYAYNLAAGTWENFGNQLSGQVNGEAFGSSVALSFDGLALTVGSPGAAIPDKIDSGSVRSFRYINGLWKPVIGAFAGGAAGEKLGFGVAVSDDGLNIAASSIAFNNMSGRVTAFRIIDEPIRTKIYCSGVNTSNKFGFSGDTTTWTQLGNIANGYSIEDFYVSNGHYDNSINFVKAKRESDGLSYLFAAGANSAYESGIGNNLPLLEYTRINLHSDVVDKIIDIQSVCSYTRDIYTFLHLNDGSVYFAGYNAYSFDSNLQMNQYRTDFTRIK